MVQYATRVIIGLEKVHLQSITDLLVSNFTSFRLIFKICYSRRLFVICCLGEGDDETIFCNLKSVPSNCSTIFFIVNSYTGHNFGMIKNAYVRLLTSVHGSQQEVIRFALNGTGNPQHTACIMAKVKPGAIQAKLHIQLTCARLMS